MIIANLMNLTGIHPNEMYRWFMEMYIDAYDWVMVPNVYGMGSYADGGIFSTSHISVVQATCLDVKLFKRRLVLILLMVLLRFVEKNIKFFESNPRLAVMTRSLTNMNEERKKTILKAQKNLSREILPNLYSPGLLEEIFIAGCVIFLVLWSITLHMTEKRHLKANLNSFTKTNYILK